MRLAVIVTALTLLSACASTVSPRTPDGGAEASCTSCDGRCVETQCDPSNCGACGMACDSGEICDTGHCRAPAPTLLWARQFHASYGGGYALVATASGDVIVSGSVLGPADLGAGPTSGGVRGDPVLVRYRNADGSVQWARRFGSPQSDATAYTSIALDATENLWGAGTFAYLADVGGPSLHAGSFLGGLLGHYDPAGNYSFAMTFTNPPDRSIGSSPDNRFGAVGTATDGDALVGGYFEGPAILGNETLAHVNGGPDGIVARIGPHGEVRWRRILSATGSATVRSMVVDSDGNSFVTGIFAGTSTWGNPHVSLGSFDTVIVRLDHQGTPIWSASFGGAGDDLPTAIARDDGGNLYLTGTTDRGIVAGTDTLAGSGMYVVSLTASGTFRWSRLFVGTVRPEGIAVDRGGNVAVVGNFSGAFDLAAQSFTDNGHTQGFAALLAPNGEPRWSHAFAAGGDVAINAVAADRCGGLALAGSFAARLDLTGATLTATGSSDGFVGLWRE